MPGTGAQRHGRRTPSAVTLPIIVNGRIDQPGDWDVFRFEGRAGERDRGRSLRPPAGSPLDSLLKLTDAAGKQLAFNDDYEDKGAGLITHHADSYLRPRCPPTAPTIFTWATRSSKGGPEYAYRLRISPPRPDFELRVVPSSINARGRRRRADHRLRPAEGRLRRRHRAGAEGCARRASRSSGGRDAGRPGPGAAHADRPADAHRRAGRACDWKGRATIARPRGRPRRPCPPRT